MGEHREGYRTPCFREHGGNTTPFWRDYLQFFDLGFTRHIVTHTYNIYQNCTNSGRLCCLTLPSKEHWKHKLQCKWSNAMVWTASPDAWPDLQTLSSCRILQRQIFPQPNPVLLPTVSPLCSPLMTMFLQSPAPHHRQALFTVLFSALNNCGEGYKLFPLGFFLLSLPSSLWVPWASLLNLKRAVKTSLEQSITLSSIGLAVLCGHTRLGMTFGVRFLWSIKTKFLKAEELVNWVSSITKFLP